MHAAIQATPETPCAKQARLPPPTLRVVDSDTSKQQSDSDSDDSMFIEVDKAKGHSISDEAKRFIQKRFKKKVVKEKFLPLLNKYKTPRHAGFRRSQQTNKEVWHKLYPRVKTRDNSLSLIQRNIAKSSIAITRALDNTEKKTICLEDALTILGQTHQQVATLRREMHKQAVPYSYKQAMEKSEEDDELLYGEKFHGILLSYHSFLNNTNKI